MVSEEVMNMMMDEDGTWPASPRRDCEEREPYAIVEVPCMGGFRYVGLATREEYEKFKKENPLCYYPENNS